MRSTTKNLSHAMFAVAALVTFSSAASAANVVISITGTPTSELYGYTFPGPYTFHFTVNDSFINTTYSSFTSNKNVWSEEFVSEPPIFTDISGDGMTGTWQRPVLAEGDPWAWLETRTWTGQPELHLLVSTDGAYPLGLQVGGVDVTMIETTARIGDIFSFPETFINPADYFAALAGTYATTGTYLQISTVNPDVLGFLVDSVTITAVPEPAYTVLLTGFGLVILLMLRRRRR